MKCPTRPKARQAPGCRGVWLDRGELAAPAPVPQPQSQRRPDFVDSDYGRHSGHRRKSWLSDIFD